MASGDGRSDKLQKKKSCGKKSSGLKQPKLGPLCANESPPVSESTAAVTEAVRTGFTSSTAMMETKSSWAAVKNLLLGQKTCRWNLNYRLEEDAFVILSYHKHIFPCYSLLLSSSCPLQPEAEDVVPYASISFSRNTAERVRCQVVPQVKQPSKSKAIWVQSHFPFLVFLVSLS